MTEEEKKYVLLDIEAAIEAYVARIAAEETGSEERRKLTNSTYETVKAKMNQIWGVPKEDN